MSNARDAREQPNARLVQQRVRNRIIEWLELTSSFREQLDYQAKVPLSVSNEIVNGWDFWVSGSSKYFDKPVFSTDELDALVAYQVVMNDFCERTPDILPELAEVITDARWERLRVAAAEALNVFARRGRMSENTEIADS